MLAILAGQLALGAGTASAGERARSRQMSMKSQQPPSIRQNGGSPIRNIRKPRLISSRPGSYVLPANREAIEARRERLENQFGLHSLTGKQAPRTKGVRLRDKLLLSPSTSLEALSAALAVELKDFARKEPLFKILAEMGAGNDDIVDAMDALEWVERDELAVGDPAFVSQTFEPNRVALHKSTASLKRILKHVDVRRLGNALEPAMARHALRFEYHANQVDYLNAGTTKQLEAGAETTLVARTFWLRQLSKAVGKREPQLLKFGLTADGALSYGLDAYVSDLDLASEFFALRELAVINPGKAKRLGREFFAAVAEARTVLAAEEAHDSASSLQQK